ncbi:MAG: hypothetical protein QOC81_1215 [Thermoanaerobaculia bacterium]|jgi:hypothetical protein|nr:hypothetical protein [Thermoanaerobaculia bacterium]
MKDDTGKPAEREVRLVRKHGRLVAVPLEEGEPLRNETVRETTELIRGGRFNSLGVKRACELIEQDDIDR